MREVSIIFLSFALCLVLGIISFHVGFDILSFDSGGGNGTTISPNNYVNNFLPHYPSPNQGSNSNNGNSGSGGGGIAPGGSPGVSLININPLTFNINLAINTNTVRNITITNNGSQNATLQISQSNLTGLIILQNSNITLGPGESKSFPVTFVAPNKTGIYSGIINIGNLKVLVTLNVKKVLLLFDSRIMVLNKNAVVLQGSQLQTMSKLIPMGVNVRADVTLNYQITDYSGKVYLKRSETILVTSPRTVYMNFDTSSLPPGNYIVGLHLVYPNGVAPSSAPFSIVSQSAAEKLFGKLVFILIIAILAVSILVMGIIVLRIVRRKRSERRYQEKMKMHLRPLREIRDSYNSDS